MTSIRRRILAPLVPLTGVALLAVGLSLEAGVRRDLMAGLDRSLVVLAQGVGAAVDVELGGELELEPEGLRVLGVRGGGGDGIFRVAAESGELLFSSDDGSDLRLAGDGTGTSFTFVQVEGRRFRVCTLPVVRAPEDDAEDRADWQAMHPGEPLPAPLPRTFWVSAGKSTEAEDETLAALRTRLSAVLGALFLALTAVPAWVVSRALRPLRELSRQADAIGPESTERRLGEAAADREVVSLVAALNRALERLADAFRRERRFTADAAHELRTPIAAARTTCEVALRRERRADELRGALGSVHGTVLRMEELVHDLLAVSRLDQEELQAGQGPVDLSAITREAVQLHAPAAAAKSVRLELDLCRPLPLRGSAGLLMECVSNLVENAVRHSPEGAAVLVCTVAAPAPAVSVRDSGGGIAREHQQRIFERFYRVDAGRARRDGGAGLGLALVREIARVHGGSVHVDSTPGQGSCFTVVLGHQGAREPSGSAT